MTAVPGWPVSPGCCVRVHGVSLGSRLDQLLREDVGVAVTDARPPAHAGSYAQIVRVPTATVQRTLAAAAPAERSELDTYLSELLGWYADGVRDTSAALPPPFLVLLVAGPDTFDTDTAERAAAVLRTHLGALPGVQLYRGRTLPSPRALRKLLLEAWWVPYAATGAPYRQ